MSFKHKHKSSHTAEDLNYSVFRNAALDPQRQEMSEALISTPTQSSTTTIMRKTPSKNLEDRGALEQNLQATASTSGISGLESTLDFGETSSHRLLSPTLSPDLAKGLDGQPEASFVIRGTRVRAALTAIGLQLTAVQGPLLPCIGRAVLGLLPYDEILAAEQAERSSLWRSTCCTGRNSVLIIHTIRRSIHNKSQWRQRRIKLTSSEPDVVRDWSLKINQAIKLRTHRPSHVLAIINPYGGSKTAVKVWETICIPTFKCAGISYRAVETEREGHAREIVEAMSLAEFQSLDGIIAVGGDGLFQEIMNGILRVRAQGNSELTAATQSLRLGHVPAGSTDAVAFSLNGTRSQTTAALHIALGDRMPLDVMRVDTADGAHRFAVCVASYGYMGDLMKFSESLRWMGPGRYNAAGAITLFRGRAYRAKISYKPVDAQRLSSVRLVCRSDCNLCRERPEGGAAPDQLAFTRPATEALSHGTWKTIEGEFKGIMVLVTPCRSDRSTLGLFPYGHLSDGTLHLILVRNCSVLQYLRFLASIPKTGVEPGAFPYVDVIDVTAAQVMPIGAQSCWNVDGEILADSNFSGQVHRGLLQVFARGVE